MIHIFRNIHIIILLCALVGCESGIGTNVPNPPSSPTTTAASAVAALFSSDEDANINQVVKIPLRVLDLVVKRAVAQSFGGGCGTSDPGCTCEFLGAEDGPNNVTTSATGQAGTYGSSGDAITLDEDDFCALSDGSENTGTGPDGQGLFASFEIDADVNGVCTTEEGDITIIMASGSTGVFRNDAAPGDGSNPANHIYGAFVIEADDGSQTTVNCTITMAADESIEDASCTDEDGNTVEQSPDATCEFETA